MTYESIQIQEPVKGRIIVSAKILGPELGKVLNEEMDKLSKEHGINKEELEEELGKAKTQIEFNAIIEKYFKGELVLML